MWAMMLKLRMREGSVTDTKGRGTRGLYRAWPCC